MPVTASSPGAWSSRSTVPSNRPHRRADISR